MPVTAAGAHRTGRIQPPPPRAHPAHLAASLIDAWYRRGYIRFIDGMRHGMAELPTSDLAGLRDDLIAMSRIADTRMLAITDRLARL